MFFREKCDALYGQSTQEIQQRINGLDFGTEVYNNDIRKFQTEIGIVDGFNISREQFCSGLTGGDQNKPDCLGIRDLLPPFISSGFQVNISVGCTHKLLSSETKDREFETDMQLLESLRAFNRVVLYETKFVKIDSITGDTTIKFIMPLETTNNAEALKYANDSVLYHFYTQKYNMDCIRNWNVSINSTETRGSFHVLLDYNFDPNCASKYASVCVRNWRQLMADEVVACQEHKCYHRGKCVPYTCGVSRFGVNCSACPENTHSFEAKEPSVFKDKCDQIATASNACKRIIDKKNDQCSAVLSVENKKKLNLMYGIDCLSDGAVRLTWSEGIEVVQTQVHELKTFLAFILGVSAKHINVGLRRRIIDGTTKTQRRLLEQAALIYDNNTTEITVRIQSETSETSHHSALLWVLIILGLVLTACVMACMKMSTISKENVQDKKTSAPGPQKYIPLPVYFA